MGMYDSICGIHKFYYKLCIIIISSEGFVAIWQATQHDPCLLCHARVLLSHDPAVPCHIIIVNFVGNLNKRQHAPLPHVYQCQRRQRCGLGNH